MYGYCFCSSLHCSWLGATTSGFRLSNRRNSHGMKMDPRPSNSLPPTIQPPQPNRDWMDRIKWLSLPLLLIVFYRCLRIAIQDIGNLFGWMIGASESPITAATAPLIFGLLAATVFASIWRIVGGATVFQHVMSLKAIAGFPDHVIKRATQESKRNLLISIAGAILVLHCASWFVYHCRIGIHHGGLARSKTVATKSAKAMAVKQNDTPSNDDQP